MRRTTTSVCGSGSRTAAAPGRSTPSPYADEIGPLDEVVEDKGVTILIEPKAVLS